MIVQPNLQDIDRAERECTEKSVIEQYNFDKNTPLWYYILKEAEIKEGGECLGDLGNHILAQVFIYLTPCATNF